MTNQNFQKYASLKAQIKALSDELEILKPTIVSEMESEAMDEVVLPEIGKFYFKERRIWTYPEELEAFEKQLKADKKVAQQKGTATCEIAKDLTFRGIGENDE
jgi:hypothetical protein